MRLIQEIFIWLFIFLYVITMSAVLPVGIYAFVSDLKKRRLFKKDIIEKYSSEINVDVDLLRQISKARGVKESDATTVVRRLMADSRDKASNDFYLALCKKIEEITPYSDLPEDVRSSLLKIKEALKKSDFDYEGHIIEPLITNLTAYVELKKSYNRGRKIAFAINTVSVFSFIFGIWGLYISMSSPNISEIRNTVQSVVEQNNARVLEDDSQRE